MRPFAVAVLLAFTTSSAFAADKDEDKAKEAVAAFLKAVQAKDVGAALKVADAPFLTTDNNDNPTIIEKATDLKADLKAKFATVKDQKTVPTEVSRILDLPAIHKEVGGNDPDALKRVEKVLGDKGYIVVVGKAGMKTLPICVRIKDGKATVVGFQ